MTKRYRDEKGELTISIGQIAKETADEAAKYYQIGGIYLNATNGEEYVYISNDGVLAIFRVLTALICLSLLKIWEHFCRM